MKKRVDQDQALQERENEDALKSVRALTQSLLQVLKAYRLYEANHPILSKFLDRVKADFDRYFEEFDSFSLQVGEHRLFYRGHMVYENQDTRESLAFLFYRDGIREIRFFRGLEFQELVDFLALVRKGDLVNRMEDDLVTLFWAREFIHIDLVTIDEFLETGTVLVPASGEDLVRRPEYHGLPKGWFPETVPDTEAKDSPILLVQGVRQVINPLPGQSLAQACQLTLEEREEINREAELEQRPEYLFILVDNLIEILLHLGEDVDAYENMIAYFERTLESLLEGEQVERAVTILNKLHETIEAIVLKDKQIFAIRRILESTSRPQMIEHLGKAMKATDGNGRVGTAQAEAIRQYLLFLEKQAIEPLCKLLGEVESAKWKKAITDRIVRLCQQDIQPVVAYLTDPNPALVIQILAILRTLAHPSTAKFLSPLIRHGDPKVREETIELLGHLGEKGKDLLQKFLEDPVPYLRGKASILFARTAREEAVTPLSEIVLSKGFLDREFEEKLSFFKALAASGSERAVPILEKIARKRSLFRRAKWKEMRQLAEKTLQWMREENNRSSSPLSERNLQVNPGVEA